MPYAKPKVPRATAAAPPPAASPGTRQGPRPLLLHLAAANQSLLSSLAALPSARLGSLAWNPRLALNAADLHPSLAGVAPEALFGAVARAAHSRLHAMLDGIARYRTFPYRRDLADPPVIWSQGSARLLDYGSADADAPIALFVPSLVNRAYVLDLSARRSLLRWLASQGVRPLLLDWGAPGASERGFGISDYIEGPLADALRVANSVARGPVHVAGYCMGGTLALALAQRRRPQIRSLALLAAPWDFHAAGGQGLIFAALRYSIRHVLRELGEMPVEMLQALFLMLDPNLSQRKFASFARMDGTSDAAEDFVALEDWVNDGVPLTGPAAAECLIDWYGDNATMRGAWRVGGEAIRPELLSLPSLIVVPHNDRIVPPASASALAVRLPGALAIEPPAGHIGMVVGSKAEAGLWRPLRDWLLRGSQT